MRWHLYMKYQGITSKPKEFFERKSTNLKNIKVGGDAPKNP